MFLGPLLLKKYFTSDYVFPEQYFNHGRNLQLTRKALPLKAYFRPAIFFHIFLHSKAQTRFRASKRKNSSNSKNNKAAKILLIRSLKKLVNSLHIPKEETTWSDYYEDIHYSKAEFAMKVKMVRKFIQVINPKIVWDLAGNSGEFSEVALAMGSSVVLIDSDHQAIERAFRRNSAKLKKDQYYIQMLVDLMSPTSNYGWGEIERKSLTDRSNADLCLALALVHHLRITHNISWLVMAEFFSKLSKHLVVEFCSHNDSQVRILFERTSSKIKDISKKQFEEAFSMYYTQIDCIPLKSGHRWLYLFSRKQDYEKF